MHEECKYLTSKGFVERTFVWYMNDSFTYFNIEQYFLWSKKIRRFISICFFNLLYPYILLTSINNLLSDYIIFS